VDRLFNGSVKTCPQEVDIVETPLYFLIICFSTINVSYIYKLIGCIPWIKHYSTKILVEFETWTGNKTPKELDA
jgi:hypothetical protein